MTRSRKNLTFSRIISLLIILSIIALPLCAVTVSAEVKSDCGVAMYTPLSMDKITGIAGNWESTEMPNTEMNSGVKNQFSNAGWFDIKTDSGSYWKAEWDTQANHSYNTNDGTVTVQYPLGQSGDSWEAFSMEYAVSSADIKYVVLGINSNVDTTRVRMYACTSGWDDGGSLRSAGLNIKKGYNEIVCPVSVEQQLWRADNTIYNWNNSFEIARLKFTADANLTENIELTFDYIRFADENYNGFLYEANKYEKRVENGRTEYPMQNNIADFHFLNNLNMDTVNTSNVTINGSPVVRIMKSDFSRSLFRVDLGNLRRNTKYTVCFNGVKTADGADVNDEFIFTTPRVEPINIVPELHKVDIKSGIAGNWESAEVPDADMNSGVKNQFSNAGWFDIKTDSENYWKAEWDTTANHRYNTNDGTVTVQYPSGQYGDSWEAFSMKKAVSSVDIKYVVLGVNSNVDTTRVRMYACTSGWNDGGSLRSAGLNIEKGYNEIVCPVSVEQQPWRADNTIYNWDNSLEIARLKFTADANLSQDIELTFDYIRFVDDSYTGYMRELGQGEKIDYTPFMEYNSDNNIIDFVFPDGTELDFSTIKTANVTLNGIAADKICTKPENKRAFRAYFSSMQPITRSRMQLSGIRNMDSADIIVDEYRFTTSAKEDTTGKCLPIMSWELVENYKTTDEMLLTADIVLAGKTITAVTGGLYNNSNKEKEYVIVLASYKDDRLIDCKLAVKKLGAYQMTGEQFATMTVPDDGNIYTIKAFAIDNGDLLLLSEVITPSNSSWYKNK